MGLAYKHVTLDLLLHNSFLV